MLSCILKLDISIQYPNNASKPSFCSKRELTIDTLKLADYGNERDKDLAGDFNYKTFTRN